MKRVLALIALGFGASISFAQDTAQQPEPASPPAEAAPAAPAATGTIIIYRPGTIMGMGIACPVRYKGQEVIELGRGKYTEWVVPAGAYVLGNKSSSVEVRVAAGGTSYVRCQIKPGFMSGRADLQIVDESDFGGKKAEFEKKEPEVVFSNIPQ